MVNERTGGRTGETFHESLSIKIKWPLGSIVVVGAQFSVFERLRSLSFRFCGETPSKLALPCKGRVVKVDAFEFVYVFTISRGEHLSVNRRSPCQSQWLVPE